MPCFCFGGVTDHCPFLKWVSWEHFLAVLQLKSLAITNGHCSAPRMISFLDKTNGLAISVVFTGFHIVNEHRLLMAKTVNPHGVTLHAVHSVSSTTIHESILLSGCCILPPFSCAAAHHVYICWSTGPLGFWWLLLAFDWLLLAFGGLRWLSRPLVAFRGFWRLSLAFGSFCWLFVAAAGFWWLLFVGFSWVYSVVSTVLQQDGVVFPIKMYSCSLPWLMAGSSI